MAGAANREPKRRARAGGTASGRWWKFSPAGKLWGFESVVLLIPGLALYWFFVGQPDPAPATGPALLIDTSLLVACLVTVLSLVVLAFGRDLTAAWAAVVASVGCALLGGAVLLAGVWSPQQDRTMVLLGAGAAAAACFSIYRRRHVWRGIEVTPSQAILGVITFAAVPVFSFWTETSFLPSQNQASISGSVDAEYLADPDGPGHWVVTTTMRNPSEVRAFVIISGLRVCHWTDEEHRRGLPDEIDRAGDVRRPSGANSEICWRLDAPFGERSWLDPGAELTYRTSVLQETERPFLELQLRFAYARADRVVEVVGSQRPASSAELDKCAAAEVFDLRAPSRVNSLARQEQALMYAAVEADGGRTYLIDSRDDITCRRARPDDRFNGLERYLGLSETRIIWVDWPTPAEPAEPAG